MKQLTNEAVDLAAEKAKVTLRVFLGGPFIDPSKELPDANSYEGATLLRRRLYDDLTNDMACKVSIGEMEELIDIYKNFLGDDFDVSSMEIHHVVRRCNAIIIIPSSPGSFCELGYFSIFNRLCPNMMIILNSAYDSKPGYLHHGPVEQARQYGATVISVDLLDYDSVKTAVRKFLARMRVRAIHAPFRIAD